MKRMICILMTAMLCLSVAACGADKDTATNDSAPVSTAATEAAAEPTVGKRYATVEEYLNDPQVQKSISSQKEKSDASVTMDVFAEENTVVYAYTYQTHVDDEALESAKSSLDTSLTENASTFYAVIDELEKYVDVDSPAVRITYLNDDGTVITEKVFSR